MSKFFFKGRIERKEDYGQYGFQTKRTLKSGSKNAPLALIVNSEQRKNELEEILKQQHLHANIDVDKNAEEDIGELNALMEKTGTLVLEKTPKRNDPCPCSSGKKYKKCCG